MAKGIASFTVTADGNGDYLIGIEDEDGDTTEFTATFDQLDMMSEAIGDALDADEEDALGIDDDTDAEEEV
ncbi:hypothetical protein [Sphingomonas sp.]|uniref:hypothetical protein n=1 Tax=Sphingomonas sp. TaxID=28214 RepID=UPI001ECE3A90|nr:hypothetical protein [Sphingomonas sp.]MBX3595331.1 hypothetical protein [Sphingomonas sp.]